MNILITGAARGIGRATAIRLAADTDTTNVAINHPPADHQAATETAAHVHTAGATPHLVEADLADPTAIKTMVENAEQAMGPVDVLVNNAGICPFTDFFDIDLPLWDHVQHVNERACFLTTQEVTRRMVQSGRPGKVIAVSSISAWVGGAQQVHYTPTKAGVSSLMKSLAIVLGPKGITCNAVLPGTIATDINRDDLADPAKRASMETRIPLGRIGKPEDVAGAIWLLTRPEAGYINGAEILVDGGLFVNLQ